MKPKRAKIATFRFSLAEYECLLDGQRIDAANGGGEIIVRPLPPLSELSKKINQSARLYAMGKLRCPPHCTIDGESVRVIGMRTRLNNIHVRKLDGTWVYVKHMNQIREGGN